MIQFALCLGTIAVIAVCIVVNDQCISSVNKMVYKISATQVFIIYNTVTQVFINFHQILINYFTGQYEFKFAK